MYYDKDIDRYLTKHILGSLDTTVFAICTLRSRSMVFSMVLIACFVLLSVSTPIRPALWSCRV